MLAAEWQQIATITAGDAGERLGNPLVITSLSRDTVAVIDYGSWSIKAFSSSGKLLWNYGRRGKGPGELSGPASLSPMPNGTLLYADRGTGRLSFISRTGKLLSEQTLDFLPLRTQAIGDRFTAAWGTFDSTLRVLDASGRTVRRLPLPSSLRTVNVLALGDQHLVRLHDGSVIVAFLYASDLLAYTPDRLVMHGVAIDSIPFPAVKRWGGNATVRRVGPDPTAPRVALSAASDGTRLFILTGINVSDSSLAAGDNDPGTLIDVYDATSLRYGGTWKAPQRCYAMTYRDGVLWLLTRDPEPLITGWTLKPAQSERP